MSKTIFTVANVRRVLLKKLLFNLPSIYIMKKVNLEAMGLQEMNRSEMTEAEGGMNDRPFGHSDDHGMIKESEKKDDSTLKAAAKAIVFLILGSSL
ncbi:MAG: hypothetical protein LBK47_10050 [Prevotellaceae bacterium]|nr:hypothetical protein [Prevotellaceae bacterium]